MTDDCQFVCVTQTDYYDIVNNHKLSTQRVTGPNGQLLLLRDNMGVLKGEAVLSFLPGFTI